MSDAPTAEQLAIANLAVQMLPKIELPKKWQTMRPGDLKDLISEISNPIQSASRYMFVEDGQVPIGDLKFKANTLFEVLAEEAVARAGTILDAARGVQRAGRFPTDTVAKEYDQKLREEYRQRAAWSLEFDGWRSAFEKYLEKHQKDKMTMHEALSVIFPKSNAHMRALYWRDYLRVWSSNPQTPVSFEDDAASDDLGDEWDRKSLKDLASLAIQVRQHYDKRGQAILKSYLRTHPKTKAGGKQTAKRKAEKVAAEAAKYGGNANLPNVKPSRGKRSSQPKPIPKHSNRRRSERA